MTINDLPRFLNDALPYWGFIGFIAFSLASFALLGYFVSKGTSVQLPDKLQDVAMTFLGIVTSGLYFLIIFVTMNVWGFLQDTIRNSIREISALSNIAAYVSPLHQDERAQQILSTVKQYVDTLRGPEWDAMAKGRTLPEEEAEWFSLYRAIIALPLDADTKGMHVTQLLSNLQDANLYRNFRLNAINSMLPLALRHSLVLACVLVSFTLGVFCQKRNPLVLSAAVTFLILLSLNLSLMLMLDFPFSGIAVNRNVYRIEILQASSSAFMTEPADVTAE